MRALLTGASALFALGLLSSPSGSQAQIATTTTTLTPTEDTFVNRAIAVLNSGNSGVVDVNGLVKPELNRALIKINQAALVAGIGTKSLVSARLVITLNQPAISWGAKPTLNIHPMPNAWAESTVTWWSAFGIIPDIFANDTANPTAQVVVPNGTTGKLTFDVTKDVSNFLAGTANNGWIIKDSGWDNGVGIEFYSSESSSPSLRPVLILETVDAPQDTAAQVTFDAPGSLVLDSTVSGSVLDIPVHGRTFSSTREAILWAQSNLNGLLDFDSAGNLTGAYGETSEIGDFYAVDASKQTLVLLDDPVAALLGGLDGILTVAGTKYCLREDGCEAGLAAKQPSASPPDNCTSASSDKFCVGGSSFKRNLFIYQSVGAKVLQTAGGFQESHHFCLKGKFIPWSCKKTTGKNQLILSNAFQINYSVGGGNTEYARKAVRKTASNTHKVSQREWKFFVGVKVKDNGNVSPKLPPESKASVAGVCSTGTARDTANSGLQLSVESSKGDVSATCEGGVIGF